ncbi:ABC transporter permease [Nitrospinae bacterium AH_259_B05_G02_I21]|nr:ABC transporter permease [Nitrospinae bacterium AH_259_B05_G02_I21]
MNWRVLPAFLKKDFLVDSSYIYSFGSNILYVAISMATFFFIDRLFGNRLVSHLEPFGVAFFSYVLLNLAFFNYVGTSLGGVAGRLSSERQMGTLEALLMTPTSMATFVLSMNLWNFCIATFDMVLYLLVGALVFGVDFSSVNLLSAGCILGLSVLAFSCLGTLDACFVLAFQRGSPVAWFAGSLLGLVGGVYVPVSVLPDWLQLVARLNPVTYAVEAMQRAVYHGASLRDVSPHATALALFVLLLIPVSYWTLTRAIRRAKINGSLTHY